MPALHLVSLCVVFCFALSLEAADCPRWGGSDACNMVSAETGLPETFEPGRKSPSGGGIDMATTKNVKWVVKLGTQTYGNPTIARGRVFVGTNDEDLDDDRFTSNRGGVVKCLDEATGKLLWQLVVPKRVGMPKGMLFDHLSLGVCSAPTVDGDRVYLVTNRAEVVCLDVLGMANGNDGPLVDEGAFSVPPGSKPAAIRPSDADILWSYDMIKEKVTWPQDAANASVLVVGDLLYVCTSNGVDQSHDRVPLPDAPSLIVLDKKTGRLVGVDNEQNGRRLFHGLWSSPSLGEVAGKRLIFFGGGEGALYVFEPLAAVSKEPLALVKAWSFDCVPPEYKVVGGKPVNYRDGDKRRNKGNKNDGEFIGPSEIIASPAFHNNRVYVGIGQDPAHGRGRGALWCIDAAQAGAPAAVWSYRDIDRTISTVAVADGLVYAADVAGRLHCLDAATGRRVWMFDTKAEVWSSPLVADGKIYLGSKKGLHVLAAGRELRVLGEVRTGAPVYCTPVAANGVLYVASQRYLWAVAKPGGQSL